MSKTTPFRSRIVRLGEADPRELTPNPGNYRRHPKAQTTALAAALSELGWIDTCVVNVTTGRMVDGHARRDEAIRNGDAAVPVLYVALSAAEERLALATLDPIGALAEADKTQLGELLGGIDTGNEDLQTFLGELADREQLFRPQTDPEAPDDFATFDDDLKTDYHCPSCGYEWSGKPK